MEVAPKMSYARESAAFERLLQIMDELREGCPWDRKQTFQSLRSLTIEECYELCEELLNENLEGIKEEVGDIMLHLVFYARIAREQNAWTMSDAIDAICEKLIVRHPHIYGDVDVDNEEDVKRNWEQLKLKEGKKSVLSGVPSGLPAMIKAFRLQDKTAQVGFDWPDRKQVWDKVEEEVQELQEAIQIGKRDAIEDEFGDVLFSMINYARALGVDPEAALERTNQKFKNRFEYIEQQAERPLQDMTLEEMDTLWNQAKG